MKSFNVTYKDGRFYEVGTDKLILFSPDIEAILIIDKDRDVKLIDKTEEKFSPLNADKKLEQVKKDSLKYKKIFGTGERLYFYLPINKIRHLVFVELLEDLYLYVGHHAKSDDAALFPCICQCHEIENIEIKKTIVSPSLSDLFKRLYVHYNGNQGNPARNAFKIFLTNPGNSKSTLDSIRKKEKL